MSRGAGKNKKGPLMVYAGSRAPKAGPTLKTQEQKMRKFLSTESERERNYATGLSTM
jgi:hypothetical protein